MTELLVFFVIVLCGFILSGLIGFGANVLSMPILSLFFKIEDLVVVLAVMSFCNALYRVIENRKGIIPAEFLHIIVITIPGTMLGLWVLKNLPEEWMKFILGCFVVVIAVRNLEKLTVQQYALQTHRSNLIRQPKQAEGESLAARVFYKLVLLAGGVMQGAFVCGGPLYLIYCTHYYGKQRLQFRGMQFAVILVNSSFVFLSYLWHGAYTARLSLMIVVGLCAITTAVLISNAWLKRLKDAYLQWLIYGALLFAGFSLLVQTWSRLGIS